MDTLHSLGGSLGGDTLNEGMKGYVCCWAIAEPISWHFSGAHDPAPCSAHPRAAAYGAVRKGRVRVTRKSKEKAEIAPYPFCKFCPVETVAFPGALFFC